MTSRHQQLRYPSIHSGTAHSHGIISAAPLLTRAFSLSASAHAEDGEYGHADRYRKTLMVGLASSDGLKSPMGLAEALKQGYVLSYTEYLTRHELVR